jgi:hypothetical protein
VRAAAAVSAVCEMPGPHPQRTETHPTVDCCLLPADGLLKELLHPLGLQASRMAAVKSVSHNFLATAWQTPAEFQ